MRRRLAGLVVLVGAIVVGGYLLRARDRVVPVEIHYVLGDPTGLSRLEAVYRERGDDEVVARFATEMLRSEVVQKTRLPRGELDVEIRLGEGPPVRRTVEVSRDAVIRLELARERR